MTATETRSAEQLAEANARRKAELIALFAWRLGIGFDDLGALPYSDKHDRHRPTLRRFAAAAFRAAGVDENVPHSRTSDTWRYLRGALDDLADRERFGFDPPPARDLLEQRGQWVDERPAPVELPAGVIVCGPHVGQLPPEDVAAVREFAELITADPRVPPDLTADAVVDAVMHAVDDVARELEQIPGRPRRVRPSDLAPYAADEAPALVTSGCPPHLKGRTEAPPRGWVEMAALGPLPGRSCRWCGGPAVVGTLNGWRCAQHWPAPGDPKGDWGWSLNWAPTALTGRCLGSRCYCGRCAHYDVTGQPVRSLRGGE